MQNIFIKICGITRVEDAIFACEQGVGALGFICWKKSKRFIAVESVQKIINEINIISPDVRKVGVFVNENVCNIAKYIDAGIDIVQFHGDETCYDISSIKKILNETYTGLEYWMAKGLQNENDINQLKKYSVDKFLIDAFVENYGGSGKLADWELAAKAVGLLDKPIILAGGIKPVNISSAIENVRPYGVDLSSGVEVSPGIKDHNLIKELFYALT